MQSKKGSRSSLLLIELIIVLFFFLLISLVCIQVFARAHTLSRSSRELSHGQTLVSSAAEILEVSDGSLENFRLYFPEIQQENDTFVFFYDEAFQTCPADSAVYTLRIQGTFEESRNEGTISFCKGETILYSLEVRFHLPLKAKEVPS